MNGYNFTDRTRQALQAAGGAAAALRHEYIGTEHVLLGLLHDRNSVASAVLTELGVNLDGIAAKVEEIVKTGSAAAPAGTQRPYTSRAKKVLELAMICAREDNHSSVGTQHLLLGLLREEKGIAAQVLLGAGVTRSQVAVAIGSVAATDEGMAAASPGLAAEAQVASVTHTRALRGAGM